MIVLSVQKKSCGSCDINPSHSHSIDPIRPGTMCLALISGFIEAFDIEPSSNEYLENLLKTLPNVVIIGMNRDRLPNTTCIYFKNITDHGLTLMAFDINGICISSGAACSVSDRAHSTSAMGIQYPTIRISSGWATTNDDFDKCFEVIKKISEFEDSLNNQSQSTTTF